MLNTANRGLACNAVNQQLGLGSPGTSLCGSDWGQFWSCHPLDGLDGNGWSRVDAPIRLLGDSIRQPRQGAPAWVIRRWLKLPGDCGHVTHPRQDQERGSPVEPSLNGQPIET